MVQEDRPFLVISDCFASHIHLIFQGLDPRFLLPRDDVSWDIAEKQIQVHVACMNHMSSKTSLYTVKIA